MVYLEHNGTKFWRCEKTGRKAVSISYGKCGSDGRTMKKELKNGAEANAYVEKQEASKRKGGYVDASDPNGGGSSTSGKRKRSHVSTSAVEPSTPSKTAGLRGHAAPALGGSDNRLVAIDSGVAGVDSALASRAQAHATLNAKLVLVNPSTNHDKVSCWKTNPSIFPALDFSLTVLGHYCIAL